MKRNQPLTCLLESNMCKSGIYRIENRTNGKCYIGSSNDLARRLKEHRYELRSGTHGNVYLQRSWDKHGESAFSFVVIAKCPVEDLLSMEQSFIDSESPAYNMCPQANGTRGFRWSEESRRRFSRVKTEFYKDSDNRRISSEARKRFYSDKSNRRKTSEAKKKYYSDPLNREKASRQRRQYLEEHPEVCEKISAAQKARNAANPNICIERGRKHSQFLRDHPDVVEKYSRQQAKLTDADAREILLRLESGES